MNIMKKYCPLSKEIAFARLDKRLNEENKKAILKSKDTIEFYFTLGMWIRNTWIYGNEEERVEALAKDLGEEIFRIKGTLVLVIISKTESRGLWWSFRK